MKYVVTLNGKNYEVDVTKTDAVITSVTPAAAAPVAPAAPADGTKIAAPMPGTILSVNTAPGSTVNAGDVLFILEAMKMENEIVSPCAGTVKQVLVSKGSTVETDAVLAVIG